MARLLTPEELRERARDIRLLVLDVDGTLTDGGMYYSADGEAMKRFNTRDAMGIRAVQRAGIIVALCTGEDSDIVRARAKKLDIRHARCGIKDKLECITEIAVALDYPWREIAYVGDDWNDREVMENVGLAFAVADAAKEIKKIAHYVTTRSGGHGAVREVCELLLEA